MGLQQTIHRRTRTSDSCRLYRADSRETLCSAHYGRLAGQGSTGGQFEGVCAVGLYADLWGVVCRDSHDHRSPTSGWLCKFSDRCLRVWRCADIDVHQDEHVDSRKVSLIASDGDTSAVDQIRVNIQTAEARTALSAFLQKHTADASCDFDLESGLSGLECLFPRGTTSQLIIPFRSSGVTVGAGDNDQYVFLIAVTSSRPAHHFRSAETTFVKSMGSILRAHWLQSQVVEADAAKTRFLSSISHEVSLVHSQGICRSLMRFPFL